MVNLSRVDLFFHMTVFKFSPFLKFLFLFVLLVFPHFSSLPYVSVKIFDTCTIVGAMRCSDFPLNGHVLERYLWLIYWKISPMSHVHTLPTTFEIHWICVPSTYTACKKPFSHGTSHIYISKKFMDYLHQYSLHIKEWPWMSIVCPCPFIPC